MRVLEQRTGDQLDNRPGDRFRELVADRSSGGSGDHELERQALPPSRWAKAADCSRPSDAVPGCDRLLGFSQRPHGIIVGEHREGLLETLELIRVDQDRSRSTVSGDDDAFVLALDPVDVLGELVSNGSQRLGEHCGDNCATQPASRATSGHDCPGGTGVDCPVEELRARRGKGH